MGGNVGETLRHAYNLNQTTAHAMAQISPTRATTISATPAISPTIAAAMSAATALAAAAAVAGNDSNK